MNMSVISINTSGFIVFEKDKKCNENNRKEILHFLCYTRYYELTDSIAIKELVY